MRTVVKVIITASFEVSETRDYIIAKAAIGRAKEQLVDAGYDVEHTEERILAGKVK
jgi:hypothetical protein